MTFSTRCRVRHAPAEARRAEGPALTAERDEALEPAPVARDRQTAVLQDPAPQVLVELSRDELRHPAVLLRLLLERWPVRRDRLIEDGLLGLVPSIAFSRRTSVYVPHGARTSRTRCPGARPSRCGSERLRDALPRAGPTRPRQVPPRADWRNRVAPDTPLLPAGAAPWAAGGAQSTGGRQLCVATRCGSAARAAGASTCTGSGRRGRGSSCSRRSTCRSTCTHPRRARAGRTCSSASTRCGRPSATPGSDGRRSSAMADSTAPWISCAQTPEEADAEPEAEPSSGAHRILLPPDLLGRVERAATCG
jgi:hypothetical protein